MARVDFTNLMEPIEPTFDQPKRYRRVKNDSFYPGVEIEVYVNEADKDDVYLAPRSVCEILGLNRNWLNTSYQRASVLDRLVRLGFNPEKRMVDVLVEKSATHLHRPCVALDRKDFDALMDYAVSIGKKDAIAIQNAFMLLGLLGVAGVSNNPAEDREAFIRLHEQCKRELGV